MIRSEVFKRAWELAREFAKINNSSPKKEFSIALFMAHSEERLGNTV